MRKLKKNINFVKSINFLYEIIYLKKKKIKLLNYIYPKKII